jgi:outer membrane protein OmpA-like peptidoglycan-associated protein
VNIVSAVGGVKQKERAMESIFSSLLFTLEHGATSQIAQKLGEPEAAVSRGLESSIATVLAGLATRSEEPGALQKLLDVVPKLPGGWSALAGDSSNAASPLLAGGRRILSGLFGGAESSITSAISREAGLGTGSASTLLAMAAPMVTTFLSRKMHDRDLTVSSIGAMLSSESATLRGALPPTVADLIWRRSEIPGASPVIAQAVQRESSFPWAGALAFGALALGGLWFFSHNRVSDIGSVATGTANRLQDDGAAAGSALKQHVPTHVDLKLPDGSGESRLLIFVQDTDAVPTDATWFDFDSWRFNKGSAKLSSKSGDELDDVAAIFKAYPQLHGKVAGYADAQGPAQANLALSEARANAVKAQLVARGVSDSRLTTEGRGEKNAVADNSTESGRADNRRAALQITDK